jgi:hypothetical protein
MKAGLLITGIIIGILGLSLFQKYFDKPSPIQSDTVLIYDTTTIIKWKNKPVPYIVVQVDSFTKTDSVYLFMNDSAECSKKLLALWKEFHTKNFYKDTLMNDSLATIIVNSLITANKVDSIGVEYRNNRPTQMITNLIGENRLYVGLFIGKNIQMPVVNYTYKKFNFGIGYDFYNSSVNGYVGYRLR